MKYQNHSLTIGIVMLGALLAASCTRDIIPADDAATRPCPLRVSALQASGVNEAVTRGTPAYPTGQLVGFFMKEDAVARYTACDNYKGVYNTTEAKWTPVPDILLNNKNADIAVYAPYDITQTVPAALSLTACLRPQDGSKDIWCERFAANNRSANLALTLKHVYTRLTLTLKRSADYKEEATLTDIALTGNEICAGSAYRFFDADPYARDGAKGFSAPSTQVLNDTHPEAAYDLLLIPTVPLTGDLTLAFTVNGKKTRVVIAKEKFTATGGKLEAGMQYTIGLTLQPGKLEITSIGIVKWDALAEVNGGNAEYEPDIPLIPDGNVNGGDYEPDPAVPDIPTNPKPV